MRTLAFVVAIFAAFFAGAASHELQPRDAHAQTTVTTIAVPWEGLVFRTPDGKAIARLSRDAQGGLFELYDDRVGATRFSSAAMGSARPTKREPYVLDDEDPWARGSSPNPRPSIGF